jgi:hypothetical protein
MTLALMYALGIVAWSLCFGRSAAWDARRRGWLTLIVMIEEAFGVFGLMWLCKSGTYGDGAAAICGAGTAAWCAMTFKRRGER